MEKGAFIMHRIHGTTVDIEGDRAVCKMKATITQRFDLGGVQADAESDCRFCFFFERYQDAAGLPAWGAKLVRHWYEKDKLVAVDPRKVCVMWLLLSDSPRALTICIKQIPEIDDELLASFPPGYRYLGYCQEKTLGGPIKVSRDLPGFIGEAHDRLLLNAKRWLQHEALEGE